MSIGFGTAKKAGGTADLMPVFRLDRETAATPSPHKVQISVAQMQICTCAIFYYSQVPNIPIATNASRVMAAARKPNGIWVMACRSLSQPVAAELRMVESE